MKNYCKKTILISGASGFIGKNITAFFKRKYNIIELHKHELKSLLVNPDLELCNVKVDMIIHCAAVVSVPKSQIDPYSFYNFNINSTLALANYCLKKNITKFIYLNTYGYGNKASNPINESAQVIPHSHYTKSKYIAEKALFDFLGEHTEVISLRIFNLYGLFQPQTFLIPSIINQAQNSDEISVNNTLTKRDYLYIKDLLNLIENIIISSNVNGVFNVGTGVSNGADYIVQCLEKILNKTLILKSANIHRPNEVIDCYADNKKAIMMFNWKIKFNIFDGLKDMLLK